MARHTPCTLTGTIFLGKGTSSRGYQGRQHFHRQTHFLPIAVGELCHRYDVKDLLRREGGAEVRHTMLLHQHFEGGLEGGFHQLINPTPLPAGPAIRALGPYLLFPERPPRAFNALKILTICTIRPIPFPAIAHLSTSSILQGHGSLR